MANGTGRLVFSYLKYQDILGTKLTKLTGRAARRRRGVCGCRGCSLVSLVFSYLKYQDILGTKLTKITGRAI